MVWEFLAAIPIFATTLVVSLRLLLKQLEQSAATQSQAQTESLERLIRTFTTPTPTTSDPEPLVELPQPEWSKMDVSTDLLERDRSLAWDEMPEILDEDSISPVPGSLT